MTFFKIQNVCKMICKTRLMRKVKRSMEERRISNCLYVCNPTPNFVLLEKKKVEIFLILEKSDNGISNFKQIAKFEINRGFVFILENCFINQQLQQNIK